MSLWRTEENLEKAEMHQSGFEHSIFIFDAFLKKVMVLSTACWNIWKTKNYRNANHSLKKCWAFGKVPNRFDTVSVN